MVKRNKGERLVNISLRAHGDAGFVVHVGDEPSSYILVSKVFPDGPAAAAGLQVGDQIYEVNGVSTESLNGGAQRRAGDFVDAVISSDSAELAVKNRPDKLKVGLLLLHNLREARSFCICGNILPTKKFPLSKFVLFP